MNTISRLSAAAAMLFVSQVAFAQQGSWECFVLTKQNSVEQVTVQATSLEAAKKAAMKNVGARAYLGPNGQSCNPPTEQAQVAGADQGQLSGADQIIQLNPQLKNIPDWMTKDIKVYGVQDCDRCTRQANLAEMRARGQQVFRCVDVQGQWGGAAWQSGGGEQGHYWLQLYPESPRVWRVFIADQNFFGGGTEKAYQVAEFDPQGKLLSSRSARSAPLSLVDFRTPGSVPATDCANPKQTSIMPASAGKIPASK